jgi:hypothetical protein
MRTIETKIYAFHELSDKAKEVAREWWRSCESMDPSWLDEHRNSLKAALCNRFNEDAVKESQGCEWTGYTDDGILADNWDGTGEAPSERMIRDWYDAALESELESRMEAQYVDDCITANEYEFYESGKIA